MRVLVAVDDSAFNEAVIEEIGARTYAADTVFRVLHVIPVPTAGNWEEWGHTATAEFNAKLSAQADSLVHKKVELLQKMLGDNIKIEWEVVKGHIADMILQVAKEWHADSIIMGSHGRTGLQKFFLGSVAEDVLSQAPSSVEFIKPAKMVLAESSEPKKHKPLLIY